MDKRPRRGDFPEILAANELLQVAYLANQAYERALQLRAQQAAASAA